MNRQILSILACVALTACVAHPARAGLINGSFEEPEIGPYGYFSYTPQAGTLTGWTVEAGTVYVVTGGGITASDGLQYAVLSDLGSPATLSQVMQATAGQTYQLSFDYTGSIDYSAGEVQGSTVGNSIIYQLFDGTTDAILAQGSVLIQSSNLYNWSTIDLQTTATTSNLGVRLLTDGAGDDGYAGPIIDNVALSAVSPTVNSVPEPSSFFLTAMAGLMALGYRLRNR